MSQGGPNHAAPRRQLAVLRRRWFLIVLLAALGGGAGVVLTSRQPPVYEATASILLRPLSPDEQAEAGGAAAVTPNVLTEIEVMRSPAVGDEVAVVLGRTPEVAVEARPRTEFIDIRARSTRAADAAVEANTFVEVYLAKPRVSPGAVEPVTTAAEPTDPVSPGPGRNGALGLGGGLALGLALANLLDRTDDRLRRKEDLEAAVDLPVLGLLPRVSRRHLEAGAVGVVAAGSPSAEAYRTLRTNLQLLAIGRQIRCLQVTSPTSNEGKSTVATNLAASFAQAGQRVIIVDGDLRRPRVHEAFGLLNEVGLSSVLSGQRSLAESIGTLDGQPCLVALTAGHVPPNPDELLGSDRARAVLATLRENCDILLIDAPAVLPVLDALVLSRHVDAILLVARPGRSTRGQVVAALQRLGQVGAPVVGTVLNGVVRKSGDEGYARPPTRVTAERRRKAPPPLPAADDGAPG